MLKPSIIAMISRQAVSTSSARSTVPRAWPRFSATTTDVRASAMLRSNISRISGLRTASASVSAHRPALLSASICSILSTPMPASVSTGSSASASRSKKAACSARSASAIAAMMLILLGK